MATVLNVHACLEFMHDAIDMLQAELIKAGDKVPEQLVLPIPDDKPKGALGTVLERSRQICMKQYIKPLFTEELHLEVLQNLRDKPLLSRKQQAVFASEGLNLSLHSKCSTLHLRACQCFILILRNKHESMERAGINCQGA